MSIDTAASALQIEQWSTQIAALAAKISAERGKNCALLLVSSTDAEYDDAAPEIIMVDALRILPYGWPAGFAIELLNGAQLDVIAPVAVGMLQPID